VQRHYEGVKAVMVPFPPAPPGGGADAATHEGAASDEVAVHEGITCDWCGAAPLRGTRYKCVQCVDADFCAGCSHRHTHGTFLTLRTPANAGWNDPLCAVASPLWGALAPDGTPPDLAVPPPPEVLAFTDGVKNLGVGQRAIAAQQGLLASEKALLEASRVSEAWASNVAMHEEEARESRTLSRLFFQRVPANAQLPLRKVYRPLSGAALCLLSRNDGKPLACVQVVALGGATGRASTLGNARGARPRYFHALLKEEGAEFGFVLTNLSHTRTKIVLKPCNGNGSASTNRSPLNGVGGCILGPGESRVVQADAATGRALTLEAAKVGAEGATVAVADATADVGSYVAVHVSFGSGFNFASHQMDERLSGGVEWMLLDLFCIDHAGYSFGGSGGATSSGSRFLAPPPPLTPATLVVPRISSGPGAFPQPSRVMESSSLGRSPGCPFNRAFGAAPSIAAPTSLVDSAVVANIVPGRQIESPAPRDTSDSATFFESTEASKILPAVLGFAVQPCLMPLTTEPCDVGLQQRAQAIVDKNLGHDRLEEVGETFVADRCVLCLESVPKPDCVLYPCAHQCVHAEEVSAIDTCPVCRTHITATLTVDAETGRATRGPARAPLQVSEVTLQRARQTSFFKPVVYLYPPREMDAIVQVDLLAGQRFTCLLPEPCDKAKGAGGSGVCLGSSASWSVRAAPDGTLTHRGGAWPPVASLFWESDLGDAGDHLRASQAGEWACVHAECLGTWLLNVLPGRGLIPHEYTEMATFWAAKADEFGTPYVLSRFLGADEIDALSSLRVSPPPDTTLRVYIAVAPAVHPPAGCGPVRGAPQTRQVPRDPSSFTAVEWGGVLSVLEAVTD